MGYTDVKSNQKSLLNSQMTGKRRRVHRSLKNMNKAKLA